MTDRTVTDSASNPPSHAAYVTRGRNGQKANWTRVGAAWPHADGKGFNLQLDAVPLDGRVALRLAPEAGN